MAAPLYCFIPRALAHAFKSCCTNRGVQGEQKRRFAMTGHDSDGSSDARRHEMIAGSRVTITKRENVETVRGGPKCQWCGKALRPKYLTERAPKDSRHFVDKRPKHVPAKFDAKRNQWLVESTAFRVVRRTFEGSFGAYGDNHFCGINCGRDYAVALIEALTSQKLRLVDRAGNDIEFHKSGIKVIIR